ncbi:MAG TPA: hypothetical protein VKU61_02510 [Candidatus Binatia bacterium]|nr:hypothetical protein [Candidatus Binatia bacterium]
MRSAHATCSTDETMDTAAPARRRRVGRPPIEESIDLLMPSQFHAPASESWWPGEKRLMLAVLADAIEVLTKGARANDLRRRLLFEDAVEWLADDDTKWPYSFVNVCAVLGLDAAAVRSALGRRRAR